MTAGKKLPISVYMITLNEIRRVRNALSSVAEWADEIVVVDSGSTDGTIEVLREFTDRVYHRDFTGFNAQYGYAQSLTKRSWVFYIDADEEVPPELADEIRALFKNGEPPADGYKIPRKTFYLGRWINHGGWYPDHVLRLYKKPKATWGTGLHPPCKLTLEGNTKKLKNHLYHYNFRDISHQIQTLDTYTRMAAEEMEQSGKDRALLKLLINPPFRFFRNYFIKLGFLDGLPGFIIAVTASYYVFVKYAKLWELKKVKKKA
jgi:glycosyltransferase involved in cell wall biosynthesis